MFSNSSPLPQVRESLFSMSVINLDTLLNDNLKKLIGSLTLLDNVYDECGACGHSTLLHKDRLCTRTENESPDIVNKIWSELRRRVKPILAKLKEVYSKEAEQNVLLDGIERLITQILGQNISNMNQYNENITILVQSIKDTFTKKEAGVSTPSVSTPASGVGVKTAKLTKPAKVPLWTKEMSLETFAKQLQTCTDILDDIPEYIKFQDLIEGLKNNKEIKGLPWYVGEHILPVLEKKTDQTMKRVLELLDIKYE